MGKCQKIEVVLHPGQVPLYELLYALLLVQEEQNGKREGVC